MSSLRVELNKVMDTKVDWDHLVGALRDGRLLSNA